MRTALILIGALALSACASGRSSEGFGEGTARLADDCRARGGVLVPAPGPMTGRPEVDNVCQISGRASRL